MNELILFDIPIRNVTMKQAIDLVVKASVDEQPCRIYFVNAHCVNLSRSDPHYLKQLQQATHVFADGVGMQLASKIAGTPLLDNVNGTDMFPLLCKAAQAQGIRLYFLGGEPGIPELVYERMKQTCSDLPCAGYHHGFYEPEDEPAVLEQIRESNADLLLVAFGVPKQEKWIDENINRCGVKAAMGVGGLFDFYSGKKARAPLWMRRVGLEWIYRLYLEPRRLWRRYLLGNVRFLFLCFKKRCWG